ncbi:MAG: hypothetical protein A2W98_09500 [Bacteroidetes bacterium GWF2_33_38]|nr:MAG: hypothetical protein A2W98_09500 [Bacteroidetes bacterium GWF2_33_38]OFY70086.1 MAG: hypothetical protein A2265_07455 [Bacteroidetes bacterium RIFOXYA12_FULL_33_9]HBX51481.1 hypothetical protein [Bacteroidales bacterium]
MGQQINSTKDAFDILKAYQKSGTEKANCISYNLRLFAAEDDFKIKQIIIPDGCEKFGFIEGKYNLSVFLQFVADMLEE